MSKAGSVFHRYTKCTQRQRVAASVVFALTYCAPAVAGFISEFATLPGDAGWYGPQWETDEEGSLLPFVELTPREGGADYELEVLVQGLGVDCAWSMGPYTEQDVPFLVAVELPPEANGPGFVEVHVLMTATSPVTGAVMGHEQTPPAYVANAGASGEAWFDAAGAREHISQVLPALPEGQVEEDALVGWEVAL